jgi:hypothetical protein
MKSSEPTNKKRKVIDLDEHTFRILSIKAAAKGTNLKALIERSLKGMADDTEDAEMYAYLVKTRPEGQEMITDKEKEDFENWLDL